MGHAPGANLSCATGSYEQQRVAYEEQQARIAERQAATQQRLQIAGVVLFVALIVFAIGGRIYLNQMVAEANQRAPAPPRVASGPAPEDAPPSDPEA